MNLPRLPAYPDQYYFSLEETTKQKITIPLIQNKLLTRINGKAVFK